MRCEEERIILTVVKMGRKTLLRALLIGVRTRAIGGEIRLNSEYSKDR